MLKVVIQLIAATDSKTPIGIYKNPALEGNVSESKRIRHNRS